MHCLWWQNCVIAHFRPNFWRFLDIYAWFFNNIYGLLIEKVKNIAEVARRKKEEAGGGVPEGALPQSIVEKIEAVPTLNLLDKQDSRNTPDWHLQNPNLIQQIFNLNREENEHVFNQVDTKQLKKHDILSFELVKDKGPIHVGIYLGDNTFTHHPRGKYPCIEPLNKTYKKRIHSVFRYEKFN